MWAWLVYVECCSNSVISVLGIVDTAAYGSGRPVKDLRKSWGYNSSTIGEAIIIRYHSVGTIPAFGTVKDECTYFKTNITSP